MTFAPINHLLRHLILVLISVSSATHGIAQHSASQVELTQSEKDWIKMNPIIRLGFNPDMRPPHIVDNTGKLSGYLVDLYKKIYELTGLNITIKVGVWEDIVSQAREGEIDGLLAATLPQARTYGLAVTLPYFKVSPTVYAKANVRLSINQWSDLAGKRIVYVAGVASSEDAIELLSSISHVKAVDTRRTALKYIHENKADVMVATRSWQFNLLKYGLGDLVPVYTDLNRSFGVSAAIRQDWPQLRSIINKSLAVIGQELTGPLYLKWLDNAEREIRFDFSQRQYQWLLDHSEITLGIQTDREPMLIVSEDGSQSGVLVDIIEELKNELGLGIRLKVGSWEDIAEHVSGKKIDGLLAITQRRAEQEGLIFSKPFLNKTLVVYARSDENITIDSINELKGKQIAYLHHSGYADQLQQLETLNHISPVTTALNGLKSVFEGKVDIFIGESTDSFYIGKFGLVGVEPIFMDLTSQTGVGIGIRSEQSELVSILNAGLNAIGESRINAINAKWVALSKNNQIDVLTRQQRAWLLTHGPIKLTAFRGIEPVVIVDNGNKLRGSAIELKNLLQDVLQIPIDVELKDFHETTGKDRDLETDGFLAVVEPVAEKNQMLMTTKQLKLSVAVFAKTNASLHISGWEDLLGKRIAYTGGKLQTHKKIEQFRSAAELIPVLNNEDGLERVLTNQADVYVGSNLAIYDMIKYGFSGIHPVFIDFDSPVSMGIAVRQDRPELVDIINRGLAVIGEQRINAIYSKWMNQNITAAKQIITQQERDWLKLLPPLKISVSENRTPIEYLDENGQFSGLVVDYARIIGERLGIEFVPVSHTPSPVDRRRSEYGIEYPEVIFSMPKNHPSIENYNVTDSYMKIPLVVLVQTNKPFMQSLDDLKEQVIAVTRDSAAQYYLQTFHPGLNVTVVNSVEDGVRNVLDGEVYALLGNSISIDYFQQKFDFSGLKIAFTAPYDYELQIAVKNQFSELVPLLDKALQQFSDQEKKLIFDKWARQPIVPEVDWKIFTQWLITVMLLVSIFVAMIIYWNRRLAAEVVNRRNIQTQLECATRKAEAANKAKSDFLANISHEIRTPMNAILGFSELLQRDTQLSKAHQGLLDIINSAGNYLLALINNVLDISKIEAGQMTLSVANVEIKPVLRELEKMFKFRASEKNLALVFSGVDTLPDYIKIDEGKFRQILINLLGNAVKFTQRGSIACRINCSQVGEHCKLVIEVEDTGPGINPAETEKVFATFGQASLGEYTASGTGLGLAISRKFARLMGGDIVCTSEPGVGSCFSLNLEADIGHVVVSENIDREVVAMQKDSIVPTILLADDVDDNRMLVTQILKPLGFNVLEAVNGEQAVNQFLKQHVDLIIMDIQMPVLDGLEAIHQIKDNKRGAQVPIIALTASAFEEDKVAILEYGVEGFLRKPFKRSELLDLIAKFLDIKYQYRSDFAAEPVASLAPLKEASINTLASRPALTLVAKTTETAQRGKVLIVDDVQVNRLLLVKVLTSEGYQCKEACDGNEALDFMSTWHPDMVLLDVQMPIKNGYEVLEAVRDNAQLNTIPIVGVTADNDQAVVNRLKALGAVDVLSKPIVTKQLSQVVKQYVSESA